MFDHNGWVVAVHHAGLGVRVIDVEGKTVRIGIGKLEQGHPCRRTLWDFLDYLVVVSAADSCTWVSGSSGPNGISEIFGDPHRRDGLGGYTRASGRCFVHITILLDVAGRHWRGAPEPRRIAFWVMMLNQESRPD